MFFFLVSFLTILLRLSKPAPSLHPLPSWASEMPLISFFFWQDFICFVACRLKRLASVLLFSYSGNMLCKNKNVARVENVEDTDGLSILDLPELPLEVILGKLSPSRLYSMARVCSSLHDRCRSDHLWGRHMKEKWGRVVGKAAQKKWELFISSQRNLPCQGSRRGKSKWLLGFSCLTSLHWLKPRVNGACKQASNVLDDYMMSWYIALENGKFWFPAQVYNREHEHSGFMLSCYDAELSYDCCTDTFRAWYPPHGRRTGVIEEGVQWDRLRAPPVDTSPHDLHVSDCLDVLHPGDHIEIQWRRNKDFPYGWWYGVVGHLEPCDGNVQFCRCKNYDTVILEFNQYAEGSRWRRAEISRKGHTEEGNETTGFYGGIRKLQSKEEIEVWTRRWPTDELD